MGNIEIRFRKVMQKDKPLLEVRYLFWEPDAKMQPSFELAYSEGDSKIHPNFKPKPENGGGNLKVWTTQIAPVSQLGTITAKAWISSPPNGDPDAQKELAAGVEIQPATAPAKTVQLRQPSKQLCIMTSVNTDFPQFPIKPAPFVPDPNGTAAKPFAPSHIVDITQYIFALLAFGPQMAWSCLDSDPVMNRGDLSLLSIGDLNEAWAQLISEYIAGTLYAGPADLSTALSGSPRFDPFAKMADNSDPVLPIAAACEHLVTIALISRGFDSVASNPAGSHKGASAALASEIGGTVISDSKYLDVPLMLNDLDVQPGTCFHFNEENGGHPHIGTILRILPSQKKIQLLDTGALNSPSTTAEPTVLNLSGNQDYPAYPLDPAGSPTAIAGPAGKKNFEGVILAPSPSTSALANALERLRRSRPLGLARLVLRDRNEPDLRKSLLYCSPLLPMLGCVFRHLFSLRGHPYSDRIEARWYIGVPKGNLAIEVQASPDFNKTWGGRTRDAGLGGEFVGLLDVASLKSGKVACLGRYYYTTGVQSPIDQQYYKAEVWRTSDGTSLGSKILLNWSKTNLGEPSGYFVGSRPEGAVFETLPIGRAPSDQRPSGMDGVLAEYEAYCKAHRIATTFDGKVLLGDASKKIPEYLRGTDG